MPCISVVFRDASDVELLETFQPVSFPHTRASRESAWGKKAFIHNSFSFAVTSTASSLTFFPQLYSVYVYSQAYTESN